MEKRMYDLSVSTTDSGEIHITQGDNDEDGFVIVRPEQVDALIQWLQEAKAEIAKS